LEALDKKGRITASKAVWRTTPLEAGTPVLIHKKTPLDSCLERSDIDLSPIVDPDEIGWIWFVDGLPGLSF